VRLRSPLPALPDPAQRPGYAGTWDRHENVEAWIAVPLDGTPQRRCLLVSSALLDAHPPKKALVCALDVTELKNTQLALEQSHGRLLILNRDLDRRLEDLQRASAEKDVLFKEVQHRVKNNLQVISSLLSLQAEQAGSEQARTVLAESRDRVRSMALIHEQLSYAGHMAGIEFAQYTGRLTRYLLVMSPILTAFGCTAMSMRSLRSIRPCGAG
jgi:hypothetical protein